MAVTVASRPNLLIYANWLAAERGGPRDDFVRDTATARSCGLAPVAERTDLPAAAGALARGLRRGAAGV